MSPDGRARDRRADAEIGRDRSGNRKNLQRVGPRTLSSGRGQFPQHAATEEKAQISFTGLVFSPDGSRIYWPMSTATSRFLVSTRLIKFRRCFPFLAAGQCAVAQGGNSRWHRRFAGRQKTLCRGQSLQSPGSNSMLRPEAFCGSGKSVWRRLMWCWPARRLREQLGRPAAGRGQPSPARPDRTVRVDARSIASEGSVSVIDLNSDGHSRTPNCGILTGLHACAMAFRPWPLAGGRQRRQRHVERH